MDDSQNGRTDYWRNLRARFEKSFKQEDFDQLMSLTIMVSELFKDEERDLIDPEPEMADVFDKTAFVLTSMTEYGQAESFYQRALAIRRKIFGEAHPWFAVSLENLGSLYHELGKEDEAAKLEEQAQGIFRSKIENLNEQFSALVHDGRYGDCIPIAMEVCSLTRRVDGEASEAYAQSLNNAAFVHKQIAREYEQPEYFPVAERLYREALDVWGKVLGEDHEDYGVALNNLGELYRARGDYSAAEEYLRRALELWRKKYGETHPAYASSLNNLALLYVEKGDAAAAEQLNLQAIEIRKKTIGENHPLFAQSLNNLAKVYEEQERYADAESLLLRALNIWKHCYSPSHPEALRVLSNLVQLYEKTGDKYAIEQLMHQLSQAVKAEERDRPYQVHDFPAIGALFQQLEGGVTERFPEERRDDSATPADAALGSELFQKSLLECVRSFVTQNYANCFREAIRLNAQNPTHEVLQMFLISMQLLTGPYRGDQSEKLHAFAVPFLALTEDQPWWHALLQLTFGQTDVAQVLEGANTEEQRCQARYYAGMRFLAEGQGDKAGAEFDRCLEIKDDILERRIAEQIRNNPTPIADKILYSRASQLNHQVIGLLKERRHREAVELGSQAYEFIRDHLPENAKEFHQALYNLAGAFYLSGEYHEAEPLYKTLLELLRDDPQPDVMALAGGLNGLGLVYTETGQYTLAEPLFRESIEVMQRAGLAQDENQAQTLGNLGEVYRERNDFALALPLYDQALEIIRHAKGEKNSEYARWKKNLGILYLQMGHHSTAEGSLQEALKIQEEVLPENHPDIASSLNTLAQLCLRQKRYEEAESYIERCLQIDSKAFGEKSFKYAAAVNSLASLYLQTGRLSEAETEFERAREILQVILTPEHPYMITIWDNLSAVYAAMNQPAKALAVLEKAQASRDNLRQQLFAISSERQRLQVSQHLYIGYCAFLSLVRALPDPGGYVVKAYDWVLQQKAITAEAQSAQRDEILSGKHPELRPKFDQLTALRMRIARKTLAGPGVEGEAAHEQLLQEWIGQREDLEFQLAREVPEINSRQKLRNVTDRSIARSLSAGTAVVEFVRFQLLEFSKLVGPGEAKKPRSYYLAFIILAQAQQSLHLIDLGDGEQIDQMISDFRTSIVSQDDDRDGRDLLPAEARKPASDGKTLRAAVFDPLVSVLAGRKRLFIAPDGDLARLSFEVLPTDDGRYLIDEYQISYLSTARDILRFGASVSEEPSAAMVAADPDFDLEEKGVESATDIRARVLSQSSTSRNSAPPAASEPEAVPLEPDPSRGNQSRDLNYRDVNFRRLPGTRAEAEEIANMLGVTALFESDVLEANLKACRSPRILHLATHGFFLPDQSREADLDIPLGEFDELNNVGVGRLSSKLENPLLRSGLALAGANTWLRGKKLPAQAEDGILTAEDISGMDLTATDLAVLSACETGLGQIEVGEGVFGLRRAFVLAGAKTLVMSLWKVPDQQTKELMVEFYRRLLKGQGRADALREAQLAMKAKWHNPIFWGAFICQGDPGPLDLARVQATSSLLGD